MLYRLYLLLRIFYYPFLVWIFPLFSKSMRERIAFENKNQNESTSDSFMAHGQKAELAFEVSSEGELEQVRPALVAALEAGTRVELIYASSSVEKQCQSLAGNYENIRVLRFPLLTFFPGVSKRDPGKWLSAPKLFLCRYDFFPSLMRYGRSKNVELILLSGSLKSYERKSSGRIYRAVYGALYKSFDKVVAATAVDRKRFEENFGMSADMARAFDFRPLAIAKRLGERELTLSDKFPAYDSFLELAQTYPIRRRLVFGSFWANEANAFSRSVDFKKSLVCVFPHRLDPDSVSEIVQTLGEKTEKPVYVLGAHAQNNRNTILEYKENPGPIVVNLKGVLCESYQDFGAAFVGGGHGVSVHSLMEPFLAGCMVYCGPKVGRSTEYDLIMESNPDRLRIVDRLENLFENFEKDINHELSNMENFEKVYISGKDSVLDWLGIDHKNESKYNESV